MRFPTLYVMFFQCNYAYYKSLRNSEEQNNRNKEAPVPQEHVSLFVHVPFFSTVSFDQQVSFT